MYNNASQVASAFDEGSSLPIDRVRRYVGFFTGPEYRHDPDDALGFVFEARRLREPGYLMSVFRAYGGWDRLTWWALADLVADWRSHPAGERLQVVVREADGWAISDRMLRARWMSAGTTEGNLKLEGN